jgi:hypothetical protein
VIPTADELLAAWPFVARRFMLLPGASQPAVEAALHEARALANGYTAHEPAALFYAFARRPRAFPGGWRLMARMIAIGHARKHGVPVNFPSTAECDALCMAIVERRAGFDEVLRQLG